MLIHCSIHLMGLSWCPSNAYNNVTEFRTPWINADQNSGIDPNVDQFLSMPINANQCQIQQNWCLDPALIVIDRHWEELIGIDRHWSAMISIETHFGSMPRFWSTLGIDRGSPENCRGRWNALLSRCGHLKDSSVKELQCPKVILLKSYEHYASRKKFCENI